jgi:hypothetical protein
VDNREVERFCLNWEIRLRDSFYKVRRPKRVDLNLKIYDFSTPNVYIEHEEIDCYEAIIPKNNLHALAEIEKNNKDLVYKSMNDKEYIEKIKRDENLEIKIRNNNPTVKKAWDNYCTLLNLVYHDYANKY